MTMFRWQLFLAVGRGDYSLTSYPMKAVRTGGAQLFGKRCGDFADWGDREAPGIQTTCPAVFPRAASVIGSM